MSVESTAFVEPSPSQRRLLQALAARWPATPVDWVERAKVRPMSDGGMGSLELLLPDSGSDRIFGERVAELQFKDEDGIDVIASLNVDQEMLPFELDVWKTDFSALIRIPDSFDDLQSGG